jgi:hypothetical protein
LDLRHHLVLAEISLCYSKPGGRFPRVTHPCATKAEAFVRLACVRHAASVRSEPGSNSQVDFRTISQGKTQPKARFKELSISHNVTGNPDANAGKTIPSGPKAQGSFFFISPKADEAMWYVETYRQLGLPIHQALKPWQPGPPSTCPFISTDNEKERRYHPRPFERPVKPLGLKEKPSSGRPVLSGGTGEAGGPSLAAEAAYGCGMPTRQQLISGCPRFFRVFPAHVEINAPRATFYLHYPAAM